MRTLLLMSLLSVILLLSCGDDNSTSPENNAPVLSGISASTLAFMFPEDVCSLSADASDADGDSLAYTWTCNAGSFSPASGRSVQWTAPDYEGIFSITCTVSDGEDTDSRSLDITVVNIVTDIDGNTYQTVRIGYQWWTVENLKVTHYINGDEIPYVTGDSAWAQLTSGAYCAYDNNSENESEYGNLYNWYAVKDSRGIAPAGWHVATDEDWKELELYLGMSLEEAEYIGRRGEGVGGKLKEFGSFHWGTPNLGATNERGFTALGAGLRNYDDGLFDLLTFRAVFWTSTEYDNVNAFNRSLYSLFATIHRESSGKKSGFSVRLVRNK